MRTSHKDHMNTFGAWSKAQTFQATRQQDWTPEDNLWVDYQAYAEACGIAPSKRLSRTAFREEMRCLCGRLPEKRKARAIGSSTDSYVPHWPRVLRSPRTLLRVAA